jgi:general stress protein CsbA
MAWYLIIAGVSLVAGAVLMARLLTKKWFVFKM